MQEVKMQPKFSDRALDKKIAAGCRDFSTLGKAEKKCQKRSREEKWNCPVNTICPSI